MKIKEIVKKYKTGDFVQTALDNVILDLRDNEFVSILGPSGSGKTTLLNIIGGLDRYDSGDIIIEGKSTKDYRERDWDTYRNHRIGFVFQSYNLIQHQTILSNVELALTIAGISKSQRRKKATEVLEKVGLEDHLNKRPNQLSGGQMQRVAIARALVNDPDILLADEPTGALDSETSIQVMELLKEVAKDRLVVMVTHNADLAEKYSSRIVSLRDGKVISDTNPYVEAETEIINDKPKNKAKMGFFTSLALSFNNMLTKKGRTFLTSFAGSIGIIGIALILALSNGVNSYINDVQKDTMTSYPITIASESVDFSSMMAGPANLDNKKDESKDKLKEAVINNDALEVDKSVAIKNTDDSLSSFKKHVENPKSDIATYLGDNGVVYSYDVSFSVFAKDKDSNFIDTNSDPNEVTKSKSEFAGRNRRSQSMFLGKSINDKAENFSQIMKGKDGETVSKVVKDNYILLDGKWPEKSEEIILVLGQDKSIGSDVLYQLGYISADEYKDLADRIKSGDKIKDKKIDFNELLDKEFFVMATAKRYEKVDGKYKYQEEISDKKIDKDSKKLKISGIIRPKDERKNASILTALAYNYKLTDQIIKESNESDIVKDQLSDTKTNVLTGLNFSRDTKKDKISDAKVYLTNLEESDKSIFYQMIMAQESDKKDKDKRDDGATDLNAFAMGQQANKNPLDVWVENDPDEEILLSIYDEYIEGYSYEDNLKSFGRVDYSIPTSIDIYTDSFEDKEAVASSIEKFNQGKKEKEQIKYVDNVATLISSITSIINVISYVLIAFVAVSLIVSSIMIGIVTHISVLERTKEIGILRSLGASKKNISQVFNAETLIIGVFAGTLGVLIAWLLTFPINKIIANALEEDAVRAFLPINYAIVLIIISMIITFIGGLIPAKKAANKDPVIALRTE